MHPANFNQDTFSSLGKKMKLDKSDPVYHCRGVLKRWTNYEKKRKSKANKNHKKESKNTKK